MLRIVIADDEEKICWLMEDIIQWERLDAELVGIANDGRRALDLVSRYCPDILITDIRMPELDGLQLIERAAQSSPDTEVIVISGYQQFEYAHTAMQYGVREYLLKPLNAAALNQAIEKIGKQKDARMAQRSEQSRLSSELERLQEKERRELLLSMAHGTPAQQNLQALNRTAQTELRGIYRSIAVKVDISWERLEEVHADFVTEHIQHMAQEMLSPLAYDAICAVDGASNTVWILLRIDETRDTEELYARLYMAWTQYIRSFDCYTLSAGVSEAFPPEKAADAVRQAKELLETRILCGNHRLITMQQCQMNHGGPWHMNERLLRDLQNSVSLLQTDSAGALIQSAFEELPEENRRNCRTYWMIGGEILDAVVKALEPLYTAGETAERAGNTEYLRRYLSNVSDAAEMGKCMAHAVGQLVKRYQQKKQQRDSRPIRVVKEYVAAHLTESLTLSEVAAYAGLSPSYFSVLFKQSTGENYKDYVAACRLERAKTLLCTTNDTISSVAEQVGYTDKRYFSQQFEKYVGLKPAKYRKLYA